LKLRFGRASLDQDVEILAAVRECAGDRLELMVDCNQGWRMPWDIHPAWTFEHALALARRLEERDVYWMEEPLHRADYGGMARLRAETSVRIAGGEMTREWYEFRTLLERGCLDVFQPDAAVTCGIERLRHFAHEVADAGHTFSPHTWGSGVALVANTHLTAGTVGAPYLEYPFDPPEWTAPRRDFILATPFEPDADGWLTLSDAPGLGVELDEARLMSTRADSASYG
jgi:L-alanine-DL-glutamate epimerase-like enolase superfamily enzyme